MTLTRFGAYGESVFDALDWALPHILNVFNEVSLSELDFWNDKIELNFIIYSVELCVENKKTISFSDENNFFV